VTTALAGQIDGSIARMTDVLIIEQLKQPQIPAQYL
jgi:hypothetical protein